MPRFAKSSLNAKPEFISSNSSCVSQTSADPKLQASNLSDGFTLVADRSLVVLDTCHSPRMTNQFGECTDF